MVKNNQLECTCVLTSFGCSLPSHPRNGLSKPHLIKVGNWLASWDKSNRVLWLQLVF